MATPEQCRNYNKCGFVKWRRDHGKSFAVPLPEDGNCGISRSLCLRLIVENGNGKPHGITISVKRYGPISHKEMELGIRGDKERTKAPTQQS